MQKTQFNMWINARRKQTQIHVNTSKKKPWSQIQYAKISVTSLLLIHGEEEISLKVNLQNKKTVCSSWINCREDANYNAWGLACLANTVIKMLNRRLNTSHFYEFIHIVNFIIYQITVLNNISKVYITSKLLVWEICQTKTRQSNCMTSV